MQVKKFVEENNYEHWDDDPLSGYLYTDIYDSGFLNLLKNNIKNTLENNATTTFQTNNLVFNQNDKTYKLGSSTVFGREQNVIFDYMFDTEWFYQTPNSITNWISNKIVNDVSPIFQKVITTMLNAEPFNTDEYIVYRLHLNNLKKHEFLALHYDGNSNYFNKHGSDVRLYSCTTYLYDHIQDKGGELFSVNGFVYKPKANTAIAIKGQSTLHGVTANLDDNHRQAFTMRIIHKDDLYLPGNPKLYAWSTDTLV